MIMFQNKGIFILIAGANASGKSSVIKPKYVKGHIKHYANPDVLNDPDFPVAEENILSFNARKERDSKNSDRFAIECLKDWLTSERIRSEGIGTESNLVSKRDFRILRKAKEYGMQTELYFVGIPLETAIKREKIRADEKKQNRIRKEIIAERYRGLLNIQKHIDSGNIDIIKIFDNSRGIGEEQLLLHIENSNTIYLHPDPPEWFKEAKIKIPPVVNLEIGDDW